LSYLGRRLVVIDTKENVAGLGVEPRSSRLLDWAI